MLRFFSRQDGFTLLEVVAATTLFSVVMLISVMIQTGLTRTVAQAEDRTEETLLLQRGMTPIVRDIHRAWGNYDTGAKAVYLASPSEECSPSLVLVLGTAQIEWELVNGKLVRSLNGKSSTLEGGYSRLCFSADRNGRSVIVELTVKGANGEERTLVSSATPEGGL